MANVRSLLTLLSRFAGYGGALFLASMMLVTVADVILRALFNLPITGAYDLVQLFLVGTVFLSIPDVFLNNENIVVDFVDHLFGRAAIGCLKVAANLAAFIFLIAPDLAYGSAGVRCLANSGKYLARSVDSDDRALGPDDRGCRARLCRRQPLCWSTVCGASHPRVTPRDNPQTVGIVGFLVMVAMIFLRMPVAIALGLVGTVGYAVLNGWTQALLVLSRVPFTFASAYDLSVVPLFVLMGSIAAHSGMARELFQSINVMFSGRRGTLATATIGACAALGSVSGSSVAMVATMSHVAVPEMRRAGYDERLALGSTVAGATLGYLVSAVGDADLLWAHRRPIDSETFRSRIIPGLLLAPCRSALLKPRPGSQPHWAPVCPARRWRERLQASLGMWKLLFIFLSVDRRHLCRLVQPHRGRGSWYLRTIVIAY